MSNEYILKFNLSSFKQLETFARTANKQDNLGDKGDWLNHFIGGLDGLIARLLGVEIHYYYVHAWELVDLPGLSRNKIEYYLYKATEYHLSTLFFNMDSAIECIVFTLNALGFAVDSTRFKDVINEKELSRISPKNILGKPLDCVPGYDIYFPSLKSYWLENGDLIYKISEQHDISKHRSAIFEGGRRRTDPPLGFFERLGIEGKTEQIVVSPWTEITLVAQPKTPWRQRDPKDSDKLEYIAERFCIFINTCGAKAVEDAHNRIKLNYNEFIKR